MSSRVLSVVATALLAAVAGYGLAGAGPASDTATAAEAGQARALLLNCLRGKRPADRAAWYVGEMDQVPSGQRMRMRFTLYERIGTSKHWRRIASPSLRAWHLSDAGVKRFIYRQHVDGLKEATAYRMSIDFQWLDASGERIASAVRESGICRQPGKLANLAFRDDVHGRPGRAPGTYGYAARIHNNGAAPSAPTEIELRVNGAQVDVKRVGRLAPGERRMIRFVGPACTSGVEGRLDPASRVREISEGDNVVTVPCSRAIFD